MGGRDCTNYEICQSAYIKLVLHALKHKTTSVNSVLGHLSHDDSVVQIDDAVPLSLKSIYILRCTSQAKVRVAGYYHANDRYDDVELGKSPRRLFLEVLLMFSFLSWFPWLDNKKLQAALKNQIYTRDASRSWRQAGSDASSLLILKEPSANLVLSDYVSTEKWQQIVDSNDDLVDGSQARLNLDLSK